MAGSADHPDRGHQTRHALTFNPDHLVGAGQGGAGLELCLYFMGHNLRNRQITEELGLSGSDVQLMTDQRRRSTRSKHGDNNGSLQPVLKVMLGPTACGLGKRGAAA